MPLGCRYASSVWSVVRFAPTLYPVGGMLILEAVWSAIGSWWSASFDRHHFGYSNPPSRELIGAYPLQKLALVYS